MTRKIYLLLGVSGAGKDTTAQALLDGGHIRTICKFAAPGKELFESIYGLTGGTLNDRVKRLELCPGTNQSYLDRFIYWFHHQHDIFPPRFFLDRAMSRIEQALVNGSIAITDSRDPLEIEALIHYVRAVEGTDKQVDLVTATLHRTNCDAQTSDVHLLDNVLLLSSCTSNTLRASVFLSNDRLKDIYQNVAILTKI